jgi:ATP-dependent Lhr-like helicase
VLTREGVASEGLAGGFSAVYPVLKAMEEAGQVRRGYFVAGLGATQFALPGADDRLRFSREPSEETRPARLLAATDPANPYGAALPWPDSAAGRPERAAGARVVLLHGALIGFVTRGGKGLLTFLPDDAADHAHAAKALAEALAAADLHRRPVIETIDGERAGQSPLRAALEAAGFRHSYDGLVLPRGR